MNQAHVAAAAAFADIEASNPRVGEVVAAATAAAEEAEQAAKRARKALAAHLAEAQDLAKKVLACRAHSLVPMLELVLMPALVLASQESAALKAHLC